MPQVDEKPRATRVERDPLGTLDVPADALYGVQTLRAQSELSRSAAARRSSAFVVAQVWIKKAAALTHKETGRLDAKLADAIVAAADEVLGGQASRPVRRRSVSGRRGHVAQHERQRGARESRQRDRSAARAATYTPVHPNDHVNMAQSTNDTIPTSIRLGVSVAARTALLARVRRGCATRSAAKGAGVRRHREGGPHASAGRDADPARTGVHARTPGRSSAACGACAEAADYLRDLGIGGSAVGTGVNVEPEYPALMVKYLKQITGLDAARRRGPHPAHAEHGRCRRRFSAHCACWRST